MMQWGTDQIYAVDSRHTPPCDRVTNTLIIDETMKRRNIIRHEGKETDRSRGPSYLLKDSHVIGSVSSPNVKLRLDVDTIASQLWLKSK